MDLKEISIKSTKGSKFRRIGWANENIAYFDEQTYILKIEQIDGEIHFNLDMADITADDWEFIEDKIQLSKNILENHYLEVWDVKEFIKNIKVFISRKDMKGIDKILLEIDKLAGTELI